MPINSVKIIEILKILNYVKNANPKN